MRKLIFIIGITVLSLTSLMAQNVGINSSGAAPNTLAGLDVNFNNKGVLIPRVALTSTTSYLPMTSSPPTSLLIYNTATAGTSPNNVTPGYYYWNGTKWIAFGGSGGRDWSLLGNAGTTAGTNFLGTTDNVSLDFRTNNTIRMRILNTGNVGIGTTTPDVKLEVVGAIHTSRLGTYGTYNSAQVQGIWSISEAYTINTGSNNFGNQYGIGYAYNQAGGSPFASEHQIVFTNNGVVNAAIGLGGDGYFAGKVGIGTTSPSQRLDVNGNVKFSGALMPNGDAGNSGKILLSAGAGAAPTWGQEMLNPSQTTAIGKYYSGAFNLTSTYFTLTLTDPNCVITSTCFMTWVGNLPSGVKYGDINVTIEAQNGKWIFYITNNTPYALYNLQFSYVAFY